MKTLERTNEELRRRILSMRKTIESQARQLESAHGKAWEIEKLVIELGNSLNGGN
jgi:predicted metallo-beta-lactamase superfamily hydrolase